MTATVRLLHLNIKKFSTSTTTPHTPATLLNTKKIPFNFSFAQTLVWANAFFGAKNMALNPPLGNTSPEVLLDNAKRLDELVNGPAATVPDRADVPLDSWRQIMAMVAAAIIEAQNSITAIGLPFSTLDDAQAAVSDGKIPEGAVTWVRDIDDTELADEYKNISGTLTATGRKMPSQQSIDKYFQVLPDGTFALMADNGVVFAIDKNAVIRAVSLAVQDVIGIGDASIRLYPQASGFYILGENGMPLALGPDSVLRLVAANISGVGFEPDLIGVPLLIRGDNGIALALDNGGNLRTPGIVTDKLIVGGKDIAGGGDSVFSAGDRYVNSDGDLVPLLPDTKKMSAWGSSSLVVSGGSANFAAMASELGVEDWNNQGQPGESSFQSAARFGGVPFTLNFPGNIIPASGSVAVTCTQTPSNFRNSSLKSFTGTVAGVPGTLSWSSSSLRFTRTEAGSDVSLPGGADFIPTIPASYRDGVILLWMYKNDIKWDAAANPEVNEDVIFNNVLKTVTHLT
ncbi:TPA: hypothetical protein U6I32_005193, partial [Klebsiella pneumoniae]|nr:hypothetical protein [Klebsiella pneumoniae]